MSSVRILFAVVIAGLLTVGGVLIAQDGKKTAEAPVKLRGQLPQNWSKLGLTDKQKQDTYAIQNRYDREVDALQAQIRDLRQKEKTELDKILTPAQKDRLREIVTEKLPGAGNDVKK